MPIDITPLFNLTLEVSRAPVRLGRLGVPAIGADVKEAVGDTLETIGGGVAPGERRARPFGLTLPLHGDMDEVDPYAVGVRLRRQMRALVDNADARLQGLYFAYDDDPELNGWLVIGGGDLEYAEGGIALAEFRIALTDAYRVGNLRTHRPARRLEAYDRRLGTTPRDYLGLLYSTTYSGMNWLPLHYLPPGAGDILVGRNTRTPAFVNTLEGALPVLPNEPHATVVSYEQNELDLLSGDVVIMDRQGLAEPTYTFSGDAKPQQVYGWEEVYGSQYPLTPGDVPVMQNGLCRLRWDKDKTAYKMDSYVAGVGYVEQGRFYFAETGTAGTRFNVLRRVEVVYWTPEKAVLRIGLAQSALSSSPRIDVYMTLQRGWRGPRIEMYASLPAPSLSLRYIATRGSSRTTAFPGLVGDNTLNTGVAAGTNMVTLGSTTPQENWVSSTFDPNDPAVNALVLQSSVSVIEYSGDTWAYGSSKFGFGMDIPAATALGYLGVYLWFGSTAQTRQAETHRNTGSGTTSQTTDGGATVVVETQAAATAETLSGIQPGPGVYKVLARLRLGTGATGQVRLTKNGTPQSQYAFTNTSFVVIGLGEVTVETGTTNIGLQAWRSSGTGTDIRVDYLVFIPMEKRLVDGEYNGARDQAQAVMADAQVIPELVAR